MSTPPSDALFEKWQDGARNALTIIRLLRANDSAAISALAATLDPGETELVVGTLACVANIALSVMDEVMVRHGEPARADDILRLLALSAP